MRKIASASLGHMAEAFHRARTTPNASPSSKFTTACRPVRWRRKQARDANRPARLAEPDVVESVRPYILERIDDGIAAM
jgi:hypothetical protein